MEKNGIFLLSDAILQKYVKGFFCGTNTFLQLLRKKKMKHPHFAQSVISAAVQ